MLHHDQLVFNSCDCAVSENISSYRRDLNFLRSEGFWKTKNVKEMHEAQLEFPEGWVRGGGEGFLEKNSFCRGGVDISGTTHQYIMVHVVLVSFSLTAPLLIGFPVVSQSHSLTGGTFCFELTSSPDDDLNSMLRKCCDLHAANYFQNSQEK